MTDIRLNLDLQPVENLQEDPLRVLDEAAPKLRQMTMLLRKIRSDLDALHQAAGAVPVGIFMAAYHADEAMKELDQTLGQLGADRLQ